MEVKQASTKCKPFKHSFIYSLIPLAAHETQTLNTYMMKAVPS